MVASACMILYTAWHIEQWRRVVRFAVQICDLYRKQWWVDQWFYIALSFHYTGIFTTTTSQNSLTKYLAVRHLFKSCEYMHESDGVLYYFMHWAVTSEMSCKKTIRQNNNQLMSASHCTRVPMCRITSDNYTSQLRNNRFTNLISWIIVMLSRTANIQRDYKKNSGHSMT